MGQIVSFLSSRPIDPPNQNYSFHDSVALILEDQQPSLPIRPSIHDSPTLKSSGPHPRSREYSRRESLTIPVEEPALPIRLPVHDSPSKSSRPIHQQSHEYSRRDSLPIPVEEPALLIRRLIHESQSKSSRPIHQPSQKYSIPVEEQTFANPRLIRDSSFPSQVYSFHDSLLIPDEKPSQQHSFCDSVLIPWESVESVGESISYEPPPTVESLSESTSRHSKKKDKGKTMAIKEKWLNHYSSGQKILLVGEGDFSFSASLAMAFGTATNMIATSLNSREFLDQNYKEAPANIEKLTSRGCKVIHGVDVGTMASHPSLNGLQFDRLIFNFPHAGFKSKESPDAELSRHKNLIKKFLENGKKMINKRGEIHITHKCSKSFLGWDLELLAKNEGLMLKQKVKFDVTHYPGYNTKYGFGGDKNFNCYPSKTYKFALESPKKSKSKIDIL